MKTSLNIPNLWKSLEIRSEELNSTKRKKGKRKSVSSRGRSSAVTGDFLEFDQDEPGLERPRPESVISSLSSSSRPGTAPPSQEILEKDLLDAICWRKQSIADKDILSLVFVMMVNSKGQEIVGEKLLWYYNTICPSCPRPSFYKQIMT